MIFLGLDFGVKRVGVAVSHGVVAQAYATVDFDESDPDTFYQKLEKIIDEQKIDKIIIGLPLGKDGKETAQSVWTKQQANLLQKNLKIPIEFVEESFSSSEAQSQISNFNISQKNKNKKGLIDMESARIILGQYLNENTDSSL